MRSLKNVVFLAMCSGSGTEGMQAHPVEPDTQASVESVPLSLEEDCSLGVSNEDCSLGVWNED